MISLFEPMPDAGMPMDLMSGGIRSVALLEFLSIADAARAQAAEVVAQAEAELVHDDRAAKVAAMIDAAREESEAATRLLCEREWVGRLQDERARAASVCAQFAEDRQRYFAAAEVQVVKLALAIARRVLAREVETDGMYLAAIVRAALARVQDGSRSVLRVNPSEALDWVELGLEKVEVSGDARVSAGECVLETSVGLVELGVRPQMEEMERGFVELAERREA